jgi:aldehyde dehydrogenase (NAD+)
MYLQIVAKQRAFFDTGATRPIPFRKEQMRKLYYLVEDNSDELVNALRADLGKPLQESLTGELGMLLQDIINTVENVVSRRMPFLQGILTTGRRKSMSPST